MLYILLIIIAVGVLLISEQGQSLLKGIINLLLIFGGLYILYWIVIFIVGGISNLDKTTKDNIISVIGGIFLLFAIGFYLYGLYKKIKKGELSFKTIKTWLTNSWHQNKARFILVSILLLVVIGTWGFMFLSL